MSRPFGAYAPGVVSIVRRRVSLQLETLVICDTPRGEGSPSGSPRGFFRLLQHPSSASGSFVLGPALSVYEPASSGCALRPYTFNSFLACAAFCADSGLTFFSEGHEILTLDFNNVVGRLACDVKFCYPSAISLPEADTLCVTDSYGLHVLRLEPVSNGIVATAVSSRSHDEDWRGQVGFASTNGRQVMFSATAVYQVSRAHGGWQLWAGSEALSGAADGAGQAARFTSITAVGIDGNGAALVLDAQNDGRTVVRRIDEDGYVKTLHCPSPLDEPGGVNVNDDLCGDLLSCDSEMTFHSETVAARSPPCSSPLPQPFESAFFGGGLRCPLVLDELLVLCAPLQDAVVFLQVPGLREFPCQSGRVPPARSCSSASYPAALAARQTGNVVCCGGSADRGWSKFDVQSHDDTSSWGSSGSISGGAALARNGSRQNCVPRGLRWDGTSKAPAAALGISCALQDEEEVSSKPSCARNGKRRAPRAWTRGSAGKRSHKRFRRC